MGTKPWEMPRARSYCGKRAPKLRVLRAHAGWSKSPRGSPTTGMMLERSPTTYWVDKSTNLIWKELFSIKIKMPSNDQVQNQTVTTTYTVARVNEAVPAELFRFDQ